MQVRLAALSIDLDELHHYRRIHGLPPSREAAHAVYDVAIPRALAFAERHGIDLTFFAVGEDVDRDESAAMLGCAALAGHAVESHSFTHPYDLVRRSRVEIAREIGASFDAVQRATGRRPAGFRAPGYTVSSAVLDELEALGARFDSSVFPSPPYYLAKLTALAVLAARGSASASIVGSGRVLAAPAEPYRPGNDWWKPGGRRLVEVPIRVTRGPRLPVIGTTIALAGERGAPLLVRACGLPALFNLELHGVDFLGEDDGIGDVAAGEPSLRVPLAARMRALDAVITELRRRAYTFTTLDRAVGAWARVGDA